MSSWYRQIKLSYVYGYWVLPDGTSHVVKTSHVVDGWELLSNLEPNIDPTLKPEYYEDYRAFIQRGWGRIAGNDNARLWQKATPAQATEMAKIMAIGNWAVYLDLPDFQGSISGVNFQKLRNILLGQTKMHQPIKTVLPVRREKTVLE